MGRGSQRGHIAQLVEHQGEDVLNVDRDDRRRYGVSQPDDAYNRSPSICIAQHPPLRRSELIFTQFLEGAVVSGLTMAVMDPYTTL